MVTHGLPYFVRRDAEGREQAVCGTFVTAEQLAPQETAPTCVGCALWFEHVANVATPAALTHAVEYDAERIGGQQQAQCGLMVEAGSGVSDPTCPECREIEAQALRDLEALRAMPPVAAPPVTHFDLFAGYRRKR